MNHFINKTKKLILTQQGSIFSSALLISGMIIISRFFGFLRYRILVNFFNKEELDIFFASFRIPDLIFELLISGAISSAFIPLIIKYRNEKEKFFIYISSIINIIFTLMFFLIIFLIAFSHKIIPLITPGYPPEKINQIIYFSRILLIGQLPLMIAGNLLIGLAQAYRFFILSAIAPIVYNVSIIILTFFLSNQLKLKAPILGVIIGAFLFFISQLPIIFRVNFKYLLVLKITKGVKDFFQIVIPRILTIISAQIDATIDLTLTSFLGSGSYTIFYFAQHLQLLPVSLIGMAFGQASLPYISELYQQNKIDELKKIIINSILNLFFLTIPVAFLFIFARTPLIRLFFGGEKFDWSATVLTAYTLSYFSFSLPFHSTYYFITRCFYAFLDSKTPFNISAIGIILNTILSITFIFFFHLPVWSLAISFSISMFFNVVILFFLLLKKINYFESLKFLLSETTKIVFSSFLASLISYFLMKTLSLFILDLSRTINVFVLIMIVSFSYFLIYLFFSWFFQVKELSLINYFLLKTKEYRQKIIEIYSQNL